jgi:hypothetical protein
MMRLKMSDSILSMNQLAAEKPSVQPLGTSERTEERWSFSVPTEALKTGKPIFKHSAGPN